MSAPLGERWTQRTVTDNRNLLVTHSRHPTLEVTRLYQEVRATPNSPQRVSPRLQKSLLVASSHTSKEGSRLGTTLTTWIIVGIFVLLGTISVVAIVFGPLANRSVARYRKQFESGKLTAKDYADLLTNTRDSLLRAAGGIILLLGAVGTVGTLVYTSQTARTAQAEVAIAHDGQVTDRYSTAVDQLASTSRDERIGGIYALERVMRDSHEDQSTVVEVLAAFVRGT